MTLQENLNAIRVLKRLETAPTPTELETLAKFNGWGAMWQIFKPEHPQHQELRSLLSEREFEQANASILNAHYTHPSIVKIVWDILDRLGIKGNLHILEPSCGIGYFLADRLDHKWTAVELDPIPAAIAKHLHPKATIYNQGFETFDCPPDTFDLVVGNVPFGAYSVFEVGYEGLHIHNHFIKKALTLTRPNGIVALITSTGTMDSRRNQEFRCDLAKMATLITALRFPAGTMSNAKTSVTTDLLIFQKMPEVHRNPPWLCENCWTIGETRYPINGFYVQYPENMLGTPAIDKLYGNGRMALEASLPLEQLLERALDGLPPCYVPRVETVKKVLTPAEQALPFGYFWEIEGQIYQRERYSLRLIGSVKDNAQVVMLLAIAQITKALLSAEQSGNELEMIEERKKLNRIYDLYKDKYGLISSGKTVFRDDPRWELLLALETDGKKAPIFRESTIKGYKAPVLCNSPKDALIHCLKTKGKLDLAWIAERCR